MAFAKKLKLWLGVGDLDQPERRNSHTSSLEAEDVDTNIYVLVWHNNRK